MLLTNSGRYEESTALPFAPTSCDLLDLLERSYALLSPTNSDPESNSNDHQVIILSTLVLLQQTFRSVSSLQTVPSQVVHRLQERLLAISTKAEVPTKARIEAQYTVIAAWHLLPLSEAERAEVTAAVIGQSVLEEEGSVSLAATQELFQWSWRVLIPNVHDQLQTLLAQMPTPCSPAIPLTRGRLFVVNTLVSAFLADGKLESAFEEFMDQSDHQDNNTPMSALLRRVLQLYAPLEGGQDTCWGKVLM